jgi:hypothetical protein
MVGRQPLLLVVNDTRARNLDFYSQSGFVATRSKIPSTLKLLYKLADLEKWIDCHRVVFVGSISESPSSLVLLTHSQLVFVTEGVIEHVSASHWLSIPVERCCVLLLYSLPSLL